MSNIIKCIFCLENKESSLEHIFPDSLGGLLTTNDVCKTCNDYMGRVVDPPLINNFLMEMIRLLYKLEGKKGKVPNPFAKGQLRDEFPGEVHYRMTNQGEPKELYSVPKKMVEKNGETTNIKISVDATEKDRLVKMVNGELKRLGKEELTEEKIFSLATTIRNPLPKVFMEKELSMVDYHKAILKIIYEVTYQLLGPLYLEDSIAVEIRNVLCSKSKEIEETDLISDIKYTAPGDQEKDMLYQFRRLANKESITAVLLKLDNDIYCYVNLFCTFEGGVVVSRNSAKYDLKNPVGWVIENNVVSKKLQRKTFSEKLRDMNK